MTAFTDECDRCHKIIELPTYCEVGWFTPDTCEVKQYALCDECVAQIQSRIDA